MEYKQGVENLKLEIVKAASTGFVDLMTGVYATSESFSGEIVTKERCLLI